MQHLVWAGALITVLGLLGLLWCILLVVRAKRAGLSDEALKAALRRVVTLNLGALFLSAFGLMIVIVGIFLT